MQLPTYGGSGQASGPTIVYYLVELRQKNKPLIYSINGLFSILVVKEGLEPSTPGL